MNIISSVLSKFKATTLDGHNFKINDFFIAPHNLEVEYLTISITNGLYLSDYYLVPINTISETDIAKKTIKLSISKPDILSCLMINNFKSIDQQVIQEHWLSYNKNSSIESHYIQANFFIRMREIDTLHLLDQQFLSLREFKTWHLFFADGVKRKANKYLIDCRNWKLTGIILKDSFFNLLNSYLIDKKHIQKVILRSKTIYLDQFGKELNHLPSFNSENLSATLKLNSIIDFKGELSVNNDSLIICSNRSFKDKYAKTNYRNMELGDGVQSETSSFIH